jgi:hypothetical protein
MEIRSGGNFSKDPYEDIKTQKIERDKEEKEKLKKTEEKSKAKAAFFLWLHLMIFFKRLTKALLGPTETSKKKNLFADLLSHLEKIKDSLERLKTIDFSQDMQYLSYFSQSWHEFLEDAVQIKKSSPFFHMLEEFIQKIQEYPTKQEHSLGYYLAEFAGSDWVPFPFMELLAALHREHIASPEDSNLQKWTLSLKDLMSYIKSQSENLD